MVYGFLIIIIVVLLAKIYLLKKSTTDIVRKFDEILKTDTNTLISISSYDNTICNLADSINKQLRVLRQEHLRYTKGDRELKNAITNIAHDLRTPLTAIFGYLDMMQNTDTTDQQSHYLSIIKERTERMNLLTDELFRYSIIISEEEPAESEPVLINQILEDSIMGYYAVLSEKGISPVVNITEKPITAELNKEYLSRVFSNLLNNAIKYSDGDLFISLSDKGEISFQNTAKELSTVDVEQLFDRFYTVESAHHSTGLGLSIARTLVERMGGRITAKYEEGTLVIYIVF